MKSSQETIEREKQALDLHLSGVSTKDIAERFNVRPPSVARWIRDAKTRYELLAPSAKALPSSGTVQS